MLVGIVKHRRPERQSAGPVGFVVEVLLAPEEDELVVTSVGMSGEPNTPELGADPASELDNVVG